MNTSRRRFLTQITLGTASAWAARSFADTPARALVLPRIATPEAAGVSSSGILAFLDAMDDTKHELHSFMMLRHGSVLAEGWWVPYGPNYKHTMYSMSKSFTATAIGLAVAEGKLSVDDKVVSFFPEDVPETISDNLAALKVKHLLTMSVGSKAEPTGACVKTDNWVRTFLAHEIDKAPGSTFLYNSAATYMLSAIVQKLTGKRVIDYLTPRLFEPLGITNKTWETCPKGINTGGWGLSIPTEAMAKFGQLFLQKGEWQGKQLVPKAWVEEASTFKIQQPAKPGSNRPREEDDWQQGYCYQMWRCQHNAFRGDGAFGQFTIVLPEHDAVIVMTSETKDLQGQLDLVWKHLLLALRDKPLAEDAKAAQALKDRLAALNLPPLSNQSSSLETKIDGKTYTLETNTLGLSSVRFLLKGGQGIITFRDAKREHVLACAGTGWQRGQTALPGTPPRLIAGNTGTPFTKVAANVAWTSEDTLLLTLRYYETPHHDEVTFKFEGDKISISFLGSIAKMSGAKKDARPVLTGKA
jgi:CubicO group peptidase (beta-lactamase class C family)